MKNKGGNFLYESLVERFSSLIEQGTLKPGDRLPSVRGLQQKENVSLSTVLQAYGVLEDKGLIEARPQSGYYVRVHNKELLPEPKMTNPPLSVSRVTISELVARVHEVVSDPTFVPFGGACPSPELLPVKKLNRTLRGILRTVGLQGNSYEIPEGNRELRHQIARRCIERGLNLSPEEVITTFGCTEALNLCLRAVANPGDTIVVESPAYYGALQIIQSLGMNALEIATHPRDGVDLNALETALKKHRAKACLFTPNFHNPLGSCMPDQNKKELIELLSRRQIPLIEDDIYGDVYYGSHRPKSAKAYDKEGLVLLCDSFSKTLSPGYRVGWTAPGRFKNRVAQLKLTNTITTTTLPQMTIAEILRGGGYERYLRQIRRSYQTNVQLVAQGIRKYFPDSTKVTRPQGGFILWVEMPPSVNALHVYRKALQEKISIVPGQLFSPKQRYKNFIRISCGSPWSERIEEGLLKLGRLVEREVTRT